MVLTKRQTSYSSADIDYNSYDPNIKSYSSSSISTSSSNGFGDRCYLDPEDRVMMGGGTNKKKRKGSSLASTIFMVIQFATFAIVGFIAYTSRNELIQTTSALTILDADYSVLRENLADTESELEQARDVFSVIRQKMSEIDPQGRWKQNDVLNVDRSRALFETIIKRHDAQSDRIDLLKKSIQDLHRMELEERYGPGPYKVEFALQIDEAKKFFTIETAPAAMMPHSIYNFMRMVEGAEWDDTLLIHGDHIIVATMKTNQGELKERTTNSELLFLEYTNEFPHDDLTVGFVGKLGGPEFYINSQDNSKLHGPGTQPHHLDGDADPCFARITRGSDIVEQILEGSVAVIQHVEILNKLHSGEKTI